MNAYISRSPKRTIPRTEHCDHCGVPACVRVTTRHRYTLHFCGHHYRLHEQALTRTALTIEDERAASGAFGPSPAEVVNAS